MTRLGHSGWVVLALWATSTFAQTPTPLYDVQHSGPALPTLGSFDEQHAGNLPPTPVSVCAQFTPTPFIPPTWTPTPLGLCEPFTPTPTPVCPTTYITGQVSDVNGLVAPNRRITIDIPYEQVASGCLIHISHTTLTTDANGYLDPQFKGVAGSVVHLTLEGDTPIEVTLPPPPVVLYSELLRTARPLSP